MHPRRGHIPLLAMVVAGATAVSILAGCAAGEGPDTVTVLNSATDTAEHEANQRSFDRCAKPLGSRVEQISVPAPQVATKALRMASSDSLPDILEPDGSELPRFAETGGLRPLDELGVTVEGFSGGAVSLGSHEGTVYGIARSVNSLALFHNTELLAEAGLEPPTTWEELRAVAAESTRGDTYGVAFSASPDADGVYRFLPFFWSAGGDESRPAGAAGVAALRLWRDLVDEGSASRAVVTWNQQDVSASWSTASASASPRSPGTASPWTSGRRTAAPRASSPTRTSRSTSPTAATASSSTTPAESPTRSAPRRWDRCSSASRASRWSTSSSRDETPGRSSTGTRR